MKLLELLKKNRPDEADEENDETEENEDQEESEPKGLGSGLFSKLREIGDNAGETLAGC
jgi:hypothetical protein